MNKDELVRLFKHKLLTFLDILIEQFPKERDFPLLKLGIKSRMVSVKDTLKEFTTVILPHKHMVLNTDEDFFLTKCGSLLSGTEVTTDELDHFKKIWTSDSLTEDDKENLWKWFKLFLDIAIEYDKVRKIKN
jgi:hypothetical protein